jgi:tRNA threonylcarbamoyladenosine biosynthesis protein TsaE
VSTSHPQILGIPLQVERRHWHGEEDCAATAARIAARVSAGHAGANAFITLEGPLGAGKTTFVRHLLRALGVKGRIKSPTYAVVETYELPGPIVVSHFDFYRFSDPREFLDAGLREIFERPGLKLAEWPSQAQSVLPPCDLTIELEICGEDEREVTLTALTPTGQSLLA